MVRAAAFAILVVVWAGPGPADACIRPIAGPGERIAEGRWATVALATVRQVESRSPERPNRAFVAVLEIDRVVQGHPQAGRLVLRHEERTECPRVLPLPTQGETWVVYLPWDARGDGPVHDAWPLTWAKRIDPRFGGRADADLRDLELSLRRRP